MARGEAARIPIFWLRVAGSGRLLVEANHISRGITEPCRDLGAVRADRLHNLAAIGDNAVESCCDAIRAAILPCSHIQACRGARRSVYNGGMKKAPRYTAEHAQSGLDAAFPDIETWPNQFPGYEIVVDDPEFTSVCPKTGLPDFGTITIRYMPDGQCLELKSLKEYLQFYRNLGIFQENIVNRVLEDVVRCAQPVWAEVKGDFRPRGGIATVVVARWPRPVKGENTEPNARENGRKKR